jgi:hypothetical protein
MRQNFVLTGACLVSALIALPSQGADKSQYNLFNPTPKDQMRPMVSDQAMYTLTPATVDAGHFQIETDPVDYFHTHDTSDGGDTKTTGWAFGSTTLKLGLTDQIDFGLYFVAFTYQTDQDLVAGAKTISRGFSDISPQVKINLWGNESGTTSLAVVPSINLPTSQLYSSDYSGGVNIPFTWRAPAGFNVGLMTGIVLFENDSGKLHAQFANGVSLRRTLYGNLNAYVEFITYVDEESGDWQAGIINGGLAYQLTSDIEINAGLASDLRKQSDYNPYIGLSWRF